jgi:uncharacterized protein YkwD
MAALARRLITALLTTTLAIGLLVPAASAGSYESDALSMLNEARATAGLAPVSMYADLTDDALAWSQHMKADQELTHNPNLSAVAANWDELGENVGVGTSITALHQAFMESTSHRGNVLGDFNYVGIAVVAETPSKLWITVVFMKSLDADPAVEDDPEPYAQQQPQADDSPLATPATDPTPNVTATATAPATQPAEQIAFVREYGPIAI